MGEAMSDQPATATRKTITLKKTKTEKRALAAIAAAADELPLTPAAALAITDAMPDLWNGIRVQATQRPDGKWQAAIYYKAARIFLAPEWCTTEDKAHAIAHRHIATSLPHAMAWIRALAKMTKKPE